VIRAGEIIYEVDYPSIDKEKNTLTYMLLPKKQRFIFNQNQLAMVINKAMFEMQITMSTDQSYFHSYYNLDQPKYMYLENTLTKELVNSFPKYEIEYTDEEDTLLGFTIKKAWASHPEIGRKEVWYTNDIELKHPNWYNPYRDLDGVLMQYSILQFGVIMEFKAHNFQPSNDVNASIELDKSGEKMDFKPFYKELDELFKTMMK
jgi:hypothetical protein